jgi:VanZ family protein
LHTFLKYNRWAFLWGLLIILLTILPGRVIPVLPVFMDLFEPDKLIHILIFGVYVFLQIRSFRRQPVYVAVSQNAVLLTMMLAFSLAAGTELLQDFIIPMRNGSVYDFMANGSGCFIGWWCAERLKIKI